jgi:2-dehydropantoate 2-reductase
MRIGVMGAGAVGSLVGAILSSTYEVVLIGRKDHVETIQERGLRITGCTELHVRPEASTDATDLGGCDIVLLTVKAYDTIEAVRQASLAEPRAMMVTLQNGLDNDEKIKETAPGMVSSAAVTSLGVTYLGPGHIRHAGTGSTELGRMVCSPGEARRVADILTEGGFPTEFVDNIRGHIWLKGLVNHCINPLTVLHRCRNGVLLDVEKYRRQMAVLHDEAVEVVSSIDVPLPDEDTFARVEEVARLTADNRSSMLQDIDRGKRTEIDSITGHIIRVGKQHGLELPLSEMVYYEVKLLEPGGQRGKWVEPEVTANAEGGEGE